MLKDLKGLTFQELDDTIKNLILQVQKEEDYGVKDMLLCKIEKLLKEQDERKN